MSLYVVTVFEDQGTVDLKTFEELPPLVAYVSKTLKSCNAKVYAFDGQRLKISKPPFRYLLVGDQKFPLFTIPDQVEEDPDFGSNGKDVEDTPMDDSYVSIMDQVLADDPTSDNVAPTLPEMDELEYDDSSPG